MTCFVPVCRMHVRFCVHHLCVCAHDDAFACGRVGVRVFEMLQNVRSACVSPMCACVLYYMAACGQLGLNKECTILRTDILLVARLTRIGFFITEPSLSLSKIRLFLTFFLVLFPNIVLRLQPTPILKSPFRLRLYCKF